jgi:hypothetical protein
MIISKSKNFVYIHLDKCGGTSIETALEPFLSWSDIIIGSTPFGEKLSLVYEEKTNSLKKHSSASEIKNFIGDDWNSMYKFATVRDPEKIMISLYFYVKGILEYHIDSRSLKDITNVAYENKNKKEILFLNNKAFTNDPYFFYFIKSSINKTYIDGFIKDIIKSGSNSVQTQTSRVDDNVDLYDIDDINNNWSNILKKLNIPDSVELKKLNKSNKPNKIYLKQETVDIIKEHFAEDYAIIPKRTGQNWGNIV